MIISSLNGGLGNQMFQYAIGRVLALRNKCELKLDISQFSNLAPGDTVREFELSIFGLDKYIASAKDLNKFSLNKLQHFLVRRLHFHLPLRTNTVYESTHNYIPEILTLKGDIFLSGYWQTEKYFLAGKEMIRKDFTFPQDIEAKNVNLTEKITKSESVSVHIRRGDYVSNSSTNKYHGLCSPLYYQKACKYLERRLKKLKYFIFSDDIEWVKKNLHFGPDAVFIDHNKGEHSWKDMHLMSLCNHHIIANSSFSWWGAWLGERKKSIVIAPKNWFQDKSVETDDLIPERWIKL